MPMRFANTTASTSTPSIAPPNLMVRPLPTPEMTPPNSAESSISAPAMGDPAEKSSPNTDWKRKEKSEYIPTAYSECRMNTTPMRFKPNRKKGTFRMSSQRLMERGVTLPSKIEVPEKPPS